MGRSKALADQNQLAAIFNAFAKYEAAGRSALYVEICDGIASEPELLSRLSTLPATKQQPNLLLAAVKYLYGTASNWPHFRALANDHWQEVQAVIEERRTQTNEPARCATLLPLLASLPQPLALLEVGASAGLCLLPDMYAYDYNGQRVSASAPTALTPPVFRCTANPRTPIPTRNLDVAWRAGLDISPLDCRNADDANWLRALVWPGEGERLRLLDEAIAIARDARPHVEQGDLRNDLSALAQEAPKDATLVVFHTAALAYVQDARDRSTFATTVREMGAKWVSNESARLFGEPENSASFNVSNVWGKFLLTLNGTPVAYTDAHGASIEWIS
jgi:hypothetical protein